MDSETLPAPRTSSAAALQERDEEIRQMLEARNARRLRRGEAPLDIEQELRPPDRSLRSIRSCARRSATSSRRATTAGSGPARRPLDVEAEVEREISRLGEL